MDNEQTTVIGSAAQTAPDNSETRTERRTSLHDGYSIVSKIGDGGMGVVYLARDVRLNRFVAVKRLKPQFLGDEYVRRRFVHEAKSAAALNDPHIVHIYSTGEDDDGPYMVMEYVESAVERSGNSPAGMPRPSQTMEQYVAANGAMNPEKTVDFLLKVGSGVATAHSSGVIHRDLKPSNILIDKAGEPKIADFGLARITRPDEPCESVLTASGDRFVSLGYAAPEQESDASTTDERADVYGLGALGYFALTGRNPRFFREDEVPEKMRPVLVKALATDKSQRWQSVKAFMDALSEIKNPGKAEQQPTVKTTWRCKWCDAINPLTTTYCGGCGWDGGVECPECGSKTRFGVQFCSVCGANAREYETADNILRKIRTANDSGHYEQTAEYALHPFVFEPAGSVGRKMLAEIRDRISEAKEKLARKNELLEIIKMEIKAENYERAHKLIEEFRVLSSSADAFEDEVRSFPERIARRNLARAERAFNDRDWKTGERTLSSIAGLSEKDIPSYERLRNALRVHKLRRSLSWLPLIAIAAFLIYILTVPVAMSFWPNTRMICIWKPGYSVGCALGLEQTYAAIVRSLSPNKFFMQMPSLFSGNPEPEPADASAANDGVSSDEHEELADIRRKYTEGLEAFHEARDAAMESWRSEYETAIGAMRTDRQQNGDFEEWNRLNSEYSRFAKERDIPETPDADSGKIVKSLQRSFIANRKSRLAAVMRKFVDMSDKYISEMEKKTSDATRSGNVALAAKIHDAAANAKNNPEYVEANAFLAEYTPVDQGESNPDPDIFTHKIPEVRELSAMRDAFMTRLAELEQKYSEQVESWRAEYTDALNAFKDRCRKTGDYEGIMASKSALNDFDTYGEAALPVPNEDLRPISKLKRNYLAKREILESSYNESVRAEADAYDKKLKEFASLRTRDGFLNEAAMAVAEGNRMGEIPAVAKAKKDLTRVEKE